MNKNISNNNNKITGSRVEIKYFSNVNGNVMIKESGLNHTPVYCKSTYIIV